MAAGLLEAGIAATSAALSTAGNIAASNNLNRRNRKWQESMWNKTNEYNTPVNQKARLEEAGINPYSVLAQGGADTGVTSMPDKPQQELPNLEALGNAGNDILGAINMAKQNELLDQQKEVGNVNVEFARIKAINEIQEIQARIGDILEHKNLTKEERENLEKQNYVMQNSLDSLINRNFYESKSSELTAKNLQRKYDDEHNESVLHQRLLNWDIRLSKTREKQLFQDMKESAARIVRMVYENQLTAAQAADAINHAALNFSNSVAAWAGIYNEKRRLDMQDDINQSLKDLYESEEYRNYNSIGNSWFNSVNDAIQQYSPMPSIETTNSTNTTYKDNRGVQYERKINHTQTKKLKKKFGRKR